jgi:hypothetical protein
MIEKLQKLNNKIAKIENLLNNGFIYSKEEEDFYKRILEINKSSQVDKLFCMLNIK